MPFNSFTFEVVGGGQANSFLTVEDGDLVSVMLLPERIGSGNAEFYGQIFIASTVTPTPVLISILAADYFGASHAIGWTGRIRMESTFAIYARVFSESTIPVRCTLLTEEVS